VRRFLTESASIAYVREMLDDERGTSDDVWSGAHRARRDGPAGARGACWRGYVHGRHGRRARGARPGSAPGPFASTAVGAATRSRWPAPKRTALTCCPHSLPATIVITATTTEGELGAFAVARDAPGLEVTPTATVELARAGAYCACWAADAAVPAERHRAAAMAQAFAADELRTVGASLIQVHGGIGFTWEHDAHLYYKRLLTLKELAGGSPGQLEELASLVLDSG
jgi:hypothetical protein